MPTKIILCGASSVGKTTLANDWCLRYPHFKHIQEVARCIMEKRCISRQDLEVSLSGDKKLFLNLQRWIFEEQDKLESCYIQDGNDFISDRGPDPLAFALFHGSNEAADELAQTPAAVKCLEHYKNCFIIVLCPLDKCTDDGIRLMSSGYAERKKFTECLCYFLQKYQLPYVYCSVTDRTERLFFVDQVTRQQYPLSVIQNEANGLNNVPFLSKYPSKSSQYHILNVYITEECIHTSFELHESNRIMSRYGPDAFISIKFHRYVKPRVIVGILCNGLSINGQEYSFLGCSTGGFKGRSCFMYKGPPSHAAKVLEECGSFDSIKSPSKLLKRIGLLFSKCKQTNAVPKEVHYEADVENANGNFTDGCGRIGIQLAREILEYSEIALKVADDYIPSVYQIRYEGCKGVLAVAPEIDPSSVIFRTSMKKFDTGSQPFKSMWLCDYSKPYSYGHLNRQFITLLSALGIKDETFHKLQKAHFARLDVMTQDAEVAVQISHWKDRPDLAAKIAAVSNIEDDKYIQGELLRLKSKLVDKMEKLSLLVSESRNVFGVCDTQGILNYGECFFRPLVSGTPKTLRGKVVVCKNPCYLLGDVRVLNAVSGPHVKKLEHLVDCIVFPTRGDRPHPAEIAGSDLDGDQFFVCWQADLIPTELRSPYSYPSQELPPRKVSMKDVVEFFANFKSNVGKIDSYYKYWADVKGVASNECQQLGRLFSTSIDASKTGSVCHIPKHFIPPKGSIATNQGRIWNQLLCAALEKKKKLKQGLFSKDSCVPALAEEFVTNLMQDSHTDVTGYRLFRFALSWCMGQGYSEDEALQKLCSLSDTIHFGQFSLDQQVEAIDCGIPTSLITNALNKSKILSPRMLQSFQLNTPHSHWRFYLRADQEDFNWAHMLRALQNYQESFIVLKLQNGVCVVVHFMNHLVCGEKRKFTAGTASSYLFSGKFDYHGHHILGQEYSYDLSTEILQIYRGEKSRSFLWLGQPKPKSDEDPQYGDELVGISVDLTQFRQDILRAMHHPIVNKQSFTLMEVFVKTKRNEPAYFDLWYAEDRTESPMLSSAKDVNIEAVSIVSKNVCPQIDSSLTIETYSIEHALSLLDECAVQGNSQLFYNILSVLEKNKEDPLCYSTHPSLWPSLHTLLCSLLAKSSGRCSDKDSNSPMVLEIISKLCHCVDTPGRCIQVVAAVNRLYYGSSVDKCVSTLLGAVKFSNQASQYLEVAMNWDSLFYLNPGSAMHLAKLLEAHTIVPMTGTQEKTSCMPSTKATFDDNLSDNPIPEHLVEQYVCHFASLVLHNFLDEVPAFKEDKAYYTDNTILHLKAYNPVDPHGTIEFSDVMEDGCFKRAGCLFGFCGIEKSHAKAFSVGTWVSIAPILMRGIDTPPHSLAVGCVCRLSTLPVNVELYVLEPISACLKQSAVTGNGHWMLRQIGNVRDFRRTISALTTLLSEKQPEVLPFLLYTHPIIKFFSEDSKPHLNSISKDLQLAKQNVSATLDISGFNECQQMAIHGAMSQRVTLIQGPPGTGKTHVACKIVGLLCQQIHDKPQQGVVLVTAGSNVAVDVLTERLLNEGVRVVLIGSPEHTNSEASLHHQLKMKGIEIGKSSMADIKKAQSEILKSVQVVAATCTDAGDPLLKSMTFSTVVMDAATEVAEPVSLIPLSHGCQKLVLIGDPQQLYPRFQYRKLKHGEKNLDAQNISLFHRLQQHYSQFHLNEQFRMNSILASFPMATFYDDRLNSPGSTSQQKASIKLPFAASSLVFFDVPDVSEEQVGSSYRNTHEAEAIVKVVSHILKFQFSLTDITILTFYTAQVACIREKLSNVANRVCVCTVDSFQGQENDVIVFSCVRSNFNGELGFANREYNVNVILTRAKKLLVGIGSRKTLNAGSPLWAAWLQQRALTFQELGMLQAESYKQSGRNQSRKRFQKKGPREHVPSQYEGKKRGEMSLRIRSPPSSHFSTQHQDQPQHRASSHQPSQQQRQPQTSTYQQSRTQQRPPLRKDEQKRQ